METEKKRKPGRPRDEKPRETVTLRLTPAGKAIIDIKRKRLNLTRGEYFEDLAKKA